MEDQRASGDGFFGVEHTDSRARAAAHTLSFSPIARTAAVAVVALIGAVLWNMRPAEIASIPVAAPQTSESSVSLAAIAAAQSTDIAPQQPGDLSNFGSQVIGVLASQYAQLQAQNAYTPESGKALAEQLAPMVKAPVSYKTYAIADLTIDKDTSYARMQRYQDDLRTALAPLNANTIPEIGLFSQYVQTGDSTYLDKLNAVAKAYQDSAVAAAKISVPADALTVHVGIENAMSQFGAVLQALGQNSKDPVTTMALLESYNDAEQNMITSFDALASYVSTHSRT